jgi:hypothetical protein
MLTNPGFHAVGAAGRRLSQSHARLSLTEQILATVAPTAAGLRVAMNSLA